MVMKDNDLKYKIRLSGNTVKEIYSQLQSDANFLFSIGVMDYSLLGTKLIIVSIIFDNNNSN